MQAGHLRDCTEIPVSVARKVCQHLCEQQRPQRLGTLEGPARLVVGKAAEEKLHAERRAKLGAAAAVEDAQRATHDDGQPCADVGTRTQPLVCTHGCNAMQRTHATHTTPPRNATQRNTMPACPHARTHACTHGCTHTLTLMCAHAHARVHTAHAPHSLARSLARM